MTARLPALRTARLLALRTAWTVKASPITNILLLNFILFIIIILFLGLEKQKRKKKKEKQEAVLFCDNFFFHFFQQRNWESYFSFVNLTTFATNNLGPIRQIVDISQN